MAVILQWKWGDINQKVGYFVLFAQKFSSSKSKRKIQTNNFSLGREYSDVTLVSSDKNPSTNVNIDWVRLQ